MIQKINLLLEFFYEKKWYFFEIFRENIDFWNSTLEGVEWFSSYQIKTKIEQKHGHCILLDTKDGENFFVHCGNSLRLNDGSFKDA